MSRSLYSLLRIAFVFVIVSGIAPILKAQTTLYYIGTSSASSPAGSSNWSLTSGGSPTSTSPNNCIAVFDSNSHACFLVGNSTFSKIIVKQGYTDTINILSSSSTFLVNNTIDLQAGCIKFNALPATITGGINIGSSGTFIAPQGRKLLVGGYLNNYGIFNHNNDSLEISASCVFRGLITLNQVKFPNGTRVATIDTGSIVTIEGDLTIASAGAAQIINGPGEIQLKGNLYNNSGYKNGGGNGTIRFIGTGDQILDGHPGYAFCGTLPKLLIDKPSGTFFFKDTIGGVKTPIRLLQGTVDASTYQSTVSFADSFTLKESIPFHHVQIYSETTAILNIDSGVAMNVKGNLFLNCINTINGSGEIKLEGNLYNNAISAIGSTGGTGTIRFTGTGDQILKGNHVMAYGTLPLILIDKPSGTLFLKDTLGCIKKPIRLLQGNVDASTYQSTVCFCGSVTLKESISFHHVLLNLLGGSLKIDTGAVMTVKGDLVEVNTVNTINGPGEIRLEGNLYNNSATNQTAGTGTIRFTGTVDQILRGNHMLYNGSLPLLLIDKPSGTLFFKDTIGGIKYPIRLLQGNVDASTYQSTLSFIDSFRLKENIPFHHVLLNFQSSYGTLSIDSGINMNIKGNLSMTGQNFINGPGEVKLEGNLYNNNVYGGGGGNGTIRFMGTSDQILRGNHSIGTGTLPQLLIDKSSGTLFFKDTIGGIQKPIRLLQGTVDASTFQSTLCFYGPFTLKENIPFHHVLLNSVMNIDTNVSMNVKGNLYYAAQSSFINGPGEIKLEGNLYQDNTNQYSGSGGNGAIRFMGTGDQILRGNHTLTAGSLPKLFIDKPSGKLFLKDTIGGVRNPIRLLQGNVDASTYQSTVNLSADFTLKESIPFHHVVQFYYTASVLNIDSTVAMNIKGNLFIQGQNTINGPGEIKLQGNLYKNSGASLGGMGTGTIRFMGTTDQIIDGNNVLYGGTLPQLLIDKPSGTLFFKDTIGGVRNPIRLLQGNVDASTYNSTVGFNGAFTLKESIPFHHVFMFLPSGALNIDSGVTMKINGNLSFENTAYSQYINGLGCVELKGNAVSNYTSGYGGGTSKIILNGTTNQSVTGSNTEGVGMFPGLIVQKPSGTVSFYKKISTTGDFIVKKGYGSFIDTAYVALYTANASIGNKSDSGYVPLSNLRLRANAQLGGNLELKNQADISTYNLSLHNYNLKINNTDSATALKYTTGALLTDSSLSGSFSQKCLLNKSYRVPFKKDTSAITSVTFKLDTATLTDSTYFTVATYGTNPSLNPNNRPLPNLLDGLTDTSGNDASKYVLDRYWKYKVENTAAFTSASMKVSYLTTEYGSQNSISNQTNLKAYGYKNYQTFSPITIAGSVSSSGTLLKLNKPTMDGIVLSTTPLFKLDSLVDISSGLCCSPNSELCIKVDVTSGAKDSNETSLTVVVKKGKSPYSYLWSNGSTTNVLDHVPMGEYTVIVMDSLGNQAVVTQFAGKFTSWDTLVNVEELSDLSLSINGPNVISGDSGDFQVHALAFAKSRLKRGVSGSVLYEWSKGADFTGAVGLVNSLDFEQGGVGLMIYPKENWDGLGPRQILALADGSGTEFGGVYDSLPLSIRIKQAYDSIYLYKNNILIYTLAESQIMGENKILPDLSPVILSLSPIGKIGKVTCDFGSLTSSNLIIPCMISQFEQVGSSLDKNWVYTEYYSIDETQPMGQIISASKQYFDNMGRATQSQAYVSSDNPNLPLGPCAIMATQTIYDNYGRKVLTTLPAPLYGNSSFAYSDNFIESKAIGNIAPEAYAVKHFDEIEGALYTATGGQQQYSNTIEQPVAVSNDVEGTLGWYYSANNTYEPTIDRTDYPYSRVEYSNQPDGGVKRASGVGDALRMGAGHEVRSFTMTASTELTSIYGFADELNGKIIKSISVDQDGKQSVTFSDLEGHTLATCLSGPDNGANVHTQFVAITIPDGEYRDVHIPEGGNWAFSLVSGAPGWTPSEIEDINQNYKTISSISGPGFYRLKAAAGSGNGFVIISTNYHHFALYYYDRAGRLISSVPPKGVDYSASHNHTMTSVGNFNNLGQQNWKRSPDEGHTEYKYRTDGQVRFSQNDKQLPEGKFSYTNYDAYGRPVEVGEYEGMRGETNGDLCQTLIDGNAIYFSNQSLASASNFQCFVQNNGSGQPPTFHSPPNHASSILNDADGIPDNKSTNVTRFYYDAPQTILGRTQRFTKGRVTSNARYALGSNTTYDYATWYSYDETGKIEWTIQYIKGAGYKTIDYQYDLNGNLLHTIYQKSVKKDYFSHDYVYDKQFRLKEYSTSNYTNTAFPTPDNTKTHAKYSYYLHGPLKRVEIGNQLQGIDYTYTIDGKLKAINNPNMATGHDADGWNNAVAKDVFGMTLDYYAADYKGGEKLYVRAAPGTYNGQVNAIRWRTRVNALRPSQPTGFMDEHVFDMKYNKQGWMTEAKHGALTESYFSGTGLNHVFHAEEYYSNNEYSELGLTYDLNGNIQTLQRTGASGTVLDDLAYNYSNSTAYGSTNQLTNLTDVATPITPDQGDIKSATYTYNAIGQQVADPSQNQYLHYNVYGKVDTVFTMDGTVKQAKAVYEYDANNYRTQKKTYNYASGGTVPIHSTITVYYNDAGGNAMNIIETEYNSTTIIASHAEKQLFGAGRLGMYYADLPQVLIPGSTALPLYSGTYELADHLGNVRATISDMKLASGDVDIKSHTDYYIGGWAMPARQTASSQRYRSGYQGQFAENDAETGLNSFELRGYDPRKLRWDAPDPMNIEFSSYLAMGNSWVNVTDPSGGAPWYENQSDCSISWFDNDAAASAAWGEGNYSNLGIDFYSYTTDLNGNTNGGYIWYGASESDRLITYGAFSEGATFNWTQAMIAEHPYTWWGQGKVGQNYFASDQYQAYKDGSDIVGIGTAAVVAAPFAYEIAAYAYSNQYAAYYFYNVGLNAVKRDVIYAGVGVAARVFGPQVMFHPYAVEAMKYADKYVNYSPLILVKIIEKLGKNL